MASGMLAPSLGFAAVAVYTVSGLLGVCLQVRPTASSLVSFDGTWTVASRDDGQAPYGAGVQGRHMLAHMTVPLTPHSPRRLETRCTRRDTRACLHAKGSLYASLGARVPVNSQTVTYQLYAPCTYFDTVCQVKW